MSDVSVTPCYYFQSCVGPIMQVVIRRKRAKVPLHVRKIWWPFKWYLKWYLKPLPESTVGWLSFK